MNWYYNKYLKYKKKYLILKNNLGGELGTGAITESLSNKILDKSINFLEDRF